MTAERTASPSVCTANRSTRDSIDLRATTDYSGAAWFVDVPVGTYTLEEVDIPDKYLSPQPQQVTVTEDSKGELAATAEFYNDKKDPQYGILRVKKTSDDNTVWGFKFHLYGIAETESLGGDVIELVEIDEYAETDTYGNAYFKPVPVNGRYLLEEVEFPAQYEPQEPVDVSFINEETGEYVQEKTVSFHNSLKDGTVTVKKTADDGIVEGISFSLYTPMSDGAQYAEIVTTDATGTAVFTGVPLKRHWSLKRFCTAGNTGWNSRWRAMKKRSKVRWSNSTSPERRRSTRTISSPGET